MACALAAAARPATTAKIFIPRNETCVKSDENEWKTKSKSVMKDDQRSCDVVPNIRRPCILYSLRSEAPSLSVSRNLVPVHSMIVSFTTGRLTSIREAHEYLG